jgi:hypothetical protein
MTKRAFDIPGQACSAAKDVRVEKFSGKFDGVARDKKTIAIDAVLDALRKATKEALARTEGAAEGLHEAAALDPARTAMVRQGATYIDQAKEAAAKLKKESESTPYVFFALQMDGIVKGGLEPAADKLREALAGEAGASQARRSHGLITLGHFRSRRTHEAIRQPQGSAEGGGAIPADQGDAPRLP